MKAFVVAAPGRHDRPRRASTRFAAERAGALQGAALLSRSSTELPAHADRPPRQAPAADRAHRRPRSTSRAEPATAGDRAGADVGCAPGSAGPTPTASRVAGRDLPSRDHGPAHAHRAGLPARDTARADAGRAAAARRRAGVARRPRPHAERARRPAHLHGCARVDPGRDGGRAARRRQRVPRPDRRHRAVPRRRAALARRRRPTLDDATLREVGRAAVDARRAAGLRVPGLGHPVHKAEDPRTPRLYELAEAEGLLGPHLRLLRFVAEVHAAGQRPAPADQRRRRRRRGAASTSACRPRACAASC